MTESTETVHKEFGLLEKSQFLRDNFITSRNVRSMHSVKEALVRVSKLLFAEEVFWIVSLTGRRNPLPWTR